MRGLAADMRPGDVEALPKGVDQKFTRLRQELLFAAVDGQLDVHFAGHGCLQVVSLV